jgi:site-specific DNA-methyltransferase (adenine-specific)
VRNGYPAEKPVSLLETLVQQSSAEGDLVADPFMGSGSAGVAALKLGRRFLGNDVADESLALTRRRLLEQSGVEGQLFEPCQAMTLPFARVSTR